MWESFYSMYSDTSAFSEVGGQLMQDIAELYTTLNIKYCQLLNL